MRIYTVVMSMIDGKQETALLREGCFARREWSCRSQWWRCLRRRESWEVPVQGAKIIEKVFKEAISQLSWSVNDISGNAADFQELLAGS
jgi:hypothetical protein